MPTPHYLNVFVRTIQNTRYSLLELFLYLTDSFTQLKSYKNPFMGNLNQPLHVSKLNRTRLHPCRTDSTGSVTVDQLLTDFCKEETLTDKIMRQL